MTDLGTLTGLLYSAALLFHILRRGLIAETLNEYALARARGLNEEDE